MFSDLGIFHAPPSLPDSPKPTYSPLTRTGYRFLTCHKDPWLVLLRYGEARGSSPSKHNIPTSLTHSNPPLSTWDLPAPLLFF
jgi:hypothetical protein